MSLSGVSRTSALNHEKGPEGVWVRELCELQNVTQIVDRAGVDIISIVGSLEPSGFVGNGI